MLSLIGLLSVFHDGKQSLSSYWSSMRVITQDETPIILIVVLVIIWLYCMSSGADSTEPDMLDTAQELHSLRKTLREAGRKLIFRAEVATVRNFRFLVSCGGFGFDDRAG